MWAGGGGNMGGRDFSKKVITQTNERHNSGVWYAGKVLSALEASLWEFDHCN